MAGRRVGMGLLLVAMLWLLAACREAEATVVAPAALATDTATPQPAATAAPTETPAPTSTPAATTELVAEDPAQQVPRFEPAPCAFEAPPEREVECGYLTVAADRAEPGNEETLALHVAIFASESSRPAAEPIIYLEGGPGADALEMVPDSFEERFAPFLEEHTFIMFDQRGTGYSEPSLACPESTELMLEMLDEIVDDEEAQELNLEALGDCRARLLAEGVDLAVYDSAASAADVDDLRRALGYEQVNLYGISYGTWLAQTVMRDFPEGVRSVILDSAYPMAADLVAELPVNTNRAFATFFAGCAADPDCATAYPDLEARFWALVDALDERPIRIPVFNPTDRQNYEAALQGDDLIGLLFDALYYTDIIPALPQMIAGVEEGDYELLSVLVSADIASMEYASLGMLYAVRCAEEVPFAEGEQLDEVTNPRLRAFFEGSAAEIMELCALWAVPAAGPLENEPVTSDIAALVLAGEYDPITPPAWGQQVAQTLVNAYTFEFPGLAHGVTLDHPCPLQIAKDFLRAPQQEPDASCITAMRGPAFVVTGAPEPVTLAPFTVALLGTTYEGVAPQGWNDLGSGGFAREQTPLDQTALLQQVVRGGSTEVFLELFSEQLGAAEAPERSGAYTDEAGRQWALYEMDVQGSPVDLALVDADGATFIVILFSSSAEQTFYYEEVFVPALEAIQVVE